MSRLQKMLVIMLSLLLALSLLVGCGSATQSVSEPAKQEPQTTPSPSSNEPSATAKPEPSKTEPEKSRDFVFVSGTEATTLDPAMISDANTGRIMRQIHDLLLERVEESEIVPMLATDCTESEDGLSWNIKLRDDAKFHCGEPFNAAAVKYSFERLVDPATGSPKASALGAMDYVEIVNDYEVIVHLKKRSLQFPGTLTNYNTSIVCPKCAEEYGVDGYGTHPCGTGPLRFDHWEPGIELVMNGNPDYWGETPTVDTVTFKGISEDSSRVMMVKTGDADVIAGVPPTLVDNLTSDSSVNMITEPGYRSIMICMQTERPPLNDVRVRAAVAYAIDKKSIIDNVMRGMATYPSGLISTVVQYSNPNLDPHNYDVEKAKALLAEAGFPSGFSTTLMTPEGRYPMDRQVAEVVQQMLSDVGITAEVNVRDWGSFQSTMKDGDMDLFLLGIGNSSGDAELNFDNQYSVSGGSNYTRTNIPELEEIKANLGTCKDNEERKERLYKMQELLNDNVSAATLYYEHQFFALRSDIDGFKLYPNEQLKLAFLKRK